jgi:hypothetical protein
MKKLFVVLVIAVSVVLSSVVSAGDFKVYPGAKLDNRATNDSNELAKKSNVPSKTKVYTTSDPFGNVASFYKGMAKEYVMPGGSSKGAQMTFFIFDNGKDIATSKRWIKVQRPALGLYKEDLREMKSRDITVIILVEK